MKKIFLVICFLLTAELCLAHKDSTYNVPLKAWVLSENTAQKDTLNDGWNDDTWSPEPRQLTVEEKKEIRKNERKKRKAQRREEREENPSNFPRGVAWSSVAVALIGLAKIWLTNCK